MSMWFIHFKHILISHLISSKLVLLNRQKRDPNSDFTGLKDFLKHQRDYDKSLFSQGRQLVSSKSGTRGRFLGRDSSIHLFPKEKSLSKPFKITLHVLNMYGEKPEYTKDPKNIFHYSHLKSRVIKNTKRWVAPHSQERHGWKTVKS